MKVVHYVDAWHKTVNISARHFDNRIGAVTYILQDRTIFFVHFLEKKKRLPESQFSLIFWTAPFIDSYQMKQYFFIKPWRNYYDESNSTNIVLLKSFHYRLVKERENWNLLIKTVIPIKFKSIFFFIKNCIRFNMTTKYRILMTSFSTKLNF